MRQSIVILLLFILPGDARADGDYFQCKVSVTYVISKEGTLMTNPTWLMRELIGATFVVHRKSGEIRPLRHNQWDYLLSNEWSKHRSVTDSSPDGDYYVISVSYGPLVRVGHLYIETFRTKIGEQKPFTYTTGGNHFYAGLCW